MNNSTLKVIAVLLALILAVMLFGRDAVLPWMWVVAALLVVAFVVWLVWRFGVFAYGDEVRKHLDETREKGGSVPLAIIGWVGAAGNVVVIIWAGILALNGVPFRDAFFQVPLFWLPIVTFMGTMALNGIIQWFKARRS